MRISRKREEALPHFTIETESGSQLATYPGEELALIQAQSIALAATGDTVVRVLDDGTPLFTVRRIGKRVLTESDR